MFSKIFKGHSAVYIEARVYLDKKRFGSYKAQMLRVPLEELHKPPAFPFLHVYLT